MKTTVLWKTFLLLINQEGSWMDFKLYFIRTHAMQQKNYFNSRPRIYFFAWKFRWVRAKAIYYKPVLSITLLQFKQKSRGIEDKKIFTKFDQSTGEQPQRHWPTVYPKGDSLRLQWEQQIHRQPTEKKESNHDLTAELYFSCEGVIFHRSNNAINT